MNRGLQLNRWNNGLETDAVLRLESKKNIRTASPILSALALPVFARVHMDQVARLLVVFLLEPHRFVALKLFT